VVGCIETDDDDATADDDDATADDDDATADDDDATADDDDATADDDDATADDDDSTAPPPEPDMVVAVDRGVLLEPLEPLNGANRTPLVPGLEGSLYDFTALFQWAGFSALRAHDQGYDLCNLYTDDALVLSTTNEALDADACSYEPGGPNSAAVWSVSNPPAVYDAANYDFDAADLGIDAIVDGGFELFLRLGESYNGPNDTTQPAMWAAVAQRAYEHVATGWPDPLDLSRTPAWVEIHNEPDGFFWLGSNAGFLALYEQTWDAVTAVTADGLVAPSVGGSGFTDGGTSAWLNGSSSLTLVTDFVAANAGSRLDFLSVHYYGSCAGSDPVELVEYIAAIRAALDATGNLGIPILLTEWNIGLGSVCGTTFFYEAEVGSFVAAALTLLQDSSLGLPRAYYYDAAPLMGPFSMQDSTEEFIVRPAAFAFRAHAELAGGNKLGTSSCNSTGGDCQAPLDALVSGEAVLPLAATLPSGEHGVVLVNRGDTERIAEVQFDGVGPALSSYTLLRYPASLSSSLSLASSPDAAGHLQPATSAMQQLDQSVVTETGLPVGGQSVFVELAPHEIVVLLASD